MTATRLTLTILAAPLFATPLLASGGAAADAPHLQARSDGPRPEVLSDAPERQARGDAPGPAARSPDADHDDLVALFREWRAFEPPPRTAEGAPDYTPAAADRRRAGLRELRERLRAIDPSDWPVPERVDWHLVRAEMNGLRFQLDVLRPFARDPAFYAQVRTYESDTPAEEGPTIHGAIRLWEYPIWPRTALDRPRPLSAEEEARLARELRTVAPLLEQARGNLAGSDAGDLWAGGVRAFEEQAAALDELRERVAGEGEGGSPGDGAGAGDEAGPELLEAIAEARGASEAFAAWLRDEAPSKNGPSGIGREAYTWFLRNVLLLPLSWEDEVTITRRELARAHASLRLEENRNRGLPPLEPAGSPEEFRRMQERSLDRYMRFVEEGEILGVEPWMERALRERTFTYSPPETRNFFAQCTHREPMTLWTHLYHWWDHGFLREAPHPSPIRRGALLHNVWMSRAEGLATGMEEWMMRAGLYADEPRAREIVWVMLAARAARGLASLRAHANELTMAEAGAFHVERTPRGWMRPDLDLLGFEQHLYLRQPGYGPSYVTGARLLEETMEVRARQLGDDFTLGRFFDELNAVGVIPPSLIHWELTGDDRMIREALEGTGPPPTP